MRDVQLTRRGVLRRRACRRRGCLPDDQPRQLRVRRGAGAHYSARAIKLVGDIARHRHARAARSSTSMPEVLRPAVRAQGARRVSRRRGITGFHNSVGIGGPARQDEALDFLAAWQGCVGAQGGSFHARRHRAPTSTTPRPRARSAIIMGLQNADQFRDRRRRQVLLPPRPALRAAHLQQPEPHRLGLAPTASTAASATSAKRSSRR